MAITARVRIDITVGGEEPDDLGSMQVHGLPLLADRYTRLYVAKELHRLAAILDSDPADLDPSIFVFGPPDKIM